MSTPDGVPRLRLVRASDDLAAAVPDNGPAPEAVPYRAEHRCTGCGRVDLPVARFLCHWPDGAVTREWHCNKCRVVWQPHLKRLGAKLEPVEGASAEV